MMIEVSGTMRAAPSSRSSGIFAVGHIAMKAARSLLSPRLTSCNLNGVWFSYRAMSTLWQYEDRGCRYSVKAMAEPPGPEGQYFPSWLSVGVQRSGLQGQRCRGSFQQPRP